MSTTPPDSEPVELPYIKNKPAAFWYIKGNDTDDLAKELQQIIADSKSNTDLMTKLVSYSVRRDHRAWNDGYQKGKKTVTFDVNPTAQVMGMPLMTGRHWYEQFKQELTSIPTLWTKDDIPKQLSPYGLKCLEAARKAAGLDALPKHMP